jgi:hypothetical protein
VATAGEFGVKGELPSHPELLDWLAIEFMESGWSLKHMHRLILSSRAWRQSSVRRPEHDAVDPDNRLLGRMNLRRLEAETIRDCILAVSGQLNGKMGGPPAPFCRSSDGQGGGFEWGGSAAQHLCAGAAEYASGSPGAV